MVGAVAETVAGDGIEIDTILGDQQVKAALTLLGVVIAAEIIDEVVDQLVIDDGVIDLEDVVHHLFQGALQTVNITIRRSLKARVSGGLRGVLILLKEGQGLHVQDAFQHIVNAVLEVLVIREHLTVFGDRILLSGHIRGEAGQLLIQLLRVIREDCLA